ncbi:hypothetical protein ACJ2PR_13360, partial [Phormidesmis sp. 146-33]
ILCLYCRQGNSSFRIGTKWANQDGGIYLEDAGRRVFLKYFEERISEAVTYPGLADKVSYRRVIQLQIQKYKRCLLDSVPYEPFLRST